MELQMKKQQNCPLWKAMFLWLPMFALPTNICGKEDGMHYTQSVRQRYLVGKTDQTGVTARFTSVKSKSHCASLCMINDGCTSFIYNTERRVCKRIKKEIFSSGTPLDEIQSRYYIVDCSFPPYQDGAMVNYTRTTLGAEANYLCVKGYSSSGTGKAVCLSNGSWSETDLVCSVVDCSFPPYQDGAMVDYTNTTFGAEAIYRCAKGYSSSGTGKAVCLSNGTWSETDLVCSESFHSTWRQVATTIASTTRTYQRDNLIKLSSANCTPDLRVKADFKTWTRVTYISSYGVKMGTKFFGQSVRGLAKSSWDSFETSPQREFELFVSNGKSTHMSVDDSGSATKSTYDGYFIWLVKDDQCISKSHSSDTGSVLTSLFEGEVDPFFDTYHTDESTSTACGQRTVHVSVCELTTFKRPPYWFVRKDCSSEQHILRWNVIGGFDSSEKRSYGRKWCPDMCWHRVFDTKATPSNNEKHIRYLISGVQHGHRIMVKVEPVVATARHVILHGSQVTVGVKEFWLPADEDAFSSESLRGWMIVSTTGHVVQCTHIPESPRVKEIKEEEKHSIWFLDSRQWDKALSIDGTGTVLSGSKSNLLNKVNEGRSLRVGVLHTNGIYKAFEVDTVDVSRTGHIAVNILHNVDLVLGQNNFRFSDTCHMVSSIITTDGSYKKYRYNTGAGGNHSIVTDVAKIEWFIEL